MELNPELLQRKLYHLLEQLQNMARDIPPKYQMRIPCEILSSLANCLLNDTIFEIVKGLMDIQHVTEQHLIKQREQIINQSKVDEACILNNMDFTAEEKIKEIAALKRRHKEKLKTFDMVIANQLDEKVADQQEILEQAGVPGFYKTTNSIEIKVQIYLLDFILRLSKINLTSQL